MPNLAQARELFAAPKEKRAEVWRMANEVAGQNPITAKLLRSQIEAAGIKSKSKTAQPKTSAQKGTMTPESVRRLLSLIDLAEQTAEEKDFFQVEGILIKLRQELIKLTNVGIVGAETPKSLANPLNDRPDFMRPTPLSLNPAS